MTTTPIAAPREAETADLESLERSIARAFMDDPVANWAVPNDRLREKALRGFFRAYLKHKQPHGFVTCEDGLLGTAIWAPPGHADSSAAEAFDIVRFNFDPRHIFRLPLMVAGVMRVQRLHPKEPHFYLAAIGVDPDAQGTGLGSRLLQPVLEICDRDGVGAYLESSDPANVSFYARHGFREIGEARLPRGPVLPLMWRDPA